MLIIYALICQVKANCHRLTGIQSNIFTSTRGHESLIFYSCLYCAEKAQLVIEFTVNRQRLFKSQFLGFLTNAYNNLKG